MKFELCIGTHTSFDTFHCFANNFWSNLWQTYNAFDSRELTLSLDYFVIVPVKAVVYFYLLKFPNQFLQNLNLFLRINFIVLTGFP